MLIKFHLYGKTINLTSDNTIIKSTNFNVDKDGNMTCKNANVSGNITSSNATITGGTLKVGDNFKVDKSGNMTCNNATMSDVNIKNGTITLKRQNAGEAVLSVWGTDRNYSEIDPSSISLFASSNSYIQIDANEDNNPKCCIALISGLSGATYISNEGITTPTLTQTSLAEQKKNFEKMQNNALDILKYIDIYKYNLKSEKDTDKKHIGFVIGDNYNYSKEVTSIDNKGVDNYSFTSLCCKAIQEQQEQIEQLQEKERQKNEIIENLIKRIETLEKEVKNGQDNI